VDSDRAPLIRDWVSCVRHWGMHWGTLAHLEVITSNFSCLVVHGGGAGVRLIPLICQLYSAKSETYPRFIPQSETGCQRAGGVMDWLNWWDIGRSLLCVIMSALLVLFWLFCMPAPPKCLEIGSMPIGGDCRR
jgi:hypothetical protein